MGNYNKLEIDFVDRTIQLIEQYESIKNNFPFDAQYNHTLLINCLLGLILLPKEKTYTYIPTDKLAIVKQDYGIAKSQFHPDIKTVQDLFYNLRHAVAHFDIAFISDTEEQLIDRISFTNTEKGIHVATFNADEFLPFLRFYASILLQNLRRHG